MAKTFIEALKEKPLLCDGATGTMIYAKGIPFERSFDELNLSNPALVADVHRGYVQAGSNVVQTNTFGANRLRLAEHGLAHKTTEINQAGVALARRVANATPRQVFVAGTVGPLHQWLAPLGRLSKTEARDVFAEQAAALIQAGVDLLIFDTFADLAALDEAILTVREISTDIPIVAQVTFTEDMRTTLGHTPQNVAEQLSELSVNVIGINCSLGPSGVLRALQHLAPFVPENVYLSAQPNAGWPERIGGRIMYPAAPEYFGEYALALVEAGARLVGGCCGTTPEHITHMRAALDDPARKTVSAVRLPVTEVSTTGPVSVVEPTRMARRLANGEFVITVELSPPKGFSAEKVLAGATLLKEAGANAIDVADSPRARMRMSPWAMCHLIQSKLDVETVLHFPTRGRNILRVQGDLLAAHALNVRNIFAVMGDPTSIGDYPDALNDFDVVPSGLIKLLKQKFNNGVDESGEPLAQPTNFLVGCALNLTPADPERELKLLRRKLKNGADFALTQPVYDVALAKSFIDRYEAEFGPWTLPIVAGVLPLYNGRHAEFLHHEVPGINIPPEIRQHMHDANDNGAEMGVEIALSLIARLKTFVQGVYLVPAFGRYDLVAEIIEEI